MVASKKSFIYICDHSEQVKSRKVANTLNSAQLQRWQSVNSVLGIGTSSSRRRSSCGTKNVLVGAAAAATTVVTDDAPDKP